MKKNLLAIILALIFALSAAATAEAIADPAEAANQYLHSYALSSVYMKYMMTALTVGADYGHNINVTDKPTAAATYQAYDGNGTLTFEYSVDTKGNPVISRVICITKAASLNDAVMLAASYASILGVLPAYDSSDFMSSVQTFANSLARSNTVTYGEKTITATVFGQGSEMTAIAIFDGLDK